MMGSKEIAGQASVHLRASLAGRGAATVMRRATYVTLLVLIWLAGMWCVFVFLLGGVPRLFLLAGGFWAAVASVALAEEA
jgi:hypothetical protein